MNRLLLEPSECSPSGEIFLPPEDRRTLHLRDVLKIRVGQRIQIAVLNQGCGEAQILDHNEKGCHLQLGTLEKGTSSGPTLSLVMALPRPQTLRKVLFLAPQMGITRIALIRSSRVEKSFFHSPLLHRGEWRRHLQLGMEQAGIFQQAQVEIHERFLPFVEDRLPGWLAPGSLKLIPHPGTMSSIGDLSLPIAHDCCLAIGPEGGWQDHEIAVFEKQKFRQVDLGERILRVETALCACAAQLDLLRHLGQRVSKNQDHK